MSSHGFLHLNSLATQSFMGGDVTLDAGAVESALMVVANDATLVLPGALTYDGNAGMRVFCYVYQ